MREIIVVIGDGGGGKTTYCKRLEKEGYKYVSWDKNFDYSINLHNKLLLYNTLKNINDLIGDAQKVVIDGYSCQTDANLKYFKEIISGDVKVRIPFAPEYIIAHRRAAVGHHFKISVENIKSNYSNLLKNNPGAIFIDMKDDDRIIHEFKDIKDFAEFWKEYNKIPTQDDKRAFFKSLTNDKPEWKYQDIEMFPYFHIGYIKAYYSWVRMKEIVDFSLKTVLDIGCLHGYYCFKAHEENAKIVVGLDKNPASLLTAKKIRDLKQYPVSFMLGDIQNKLYLPKRDVTLVLNMFHCIKNIEQGLYNVFLNTKQVIFEFNPEQEASTTDFAKSMGFAKRFTMSSHRIDHVTKKNRILTYYEKEKYAKNYKRVLGN